MASEISKKKLEHDRLAKQNLLKVTESLYDQFKEGIIPNIVMPSRTKKNIEYNDESDVWVYGGRESERSSKTVKGAFQLLKTTHTIDFLLSNHLSQNRGSTLRELYYI
ncbi:DNA topoisomerase VI, partial [Methanosalsum natronophilum]